MEEIKFRAWLWKHLKVVDVTRIDFEAQEITYQEIDFEYDDVIREKTALFKDISLLQYTGLKDKHGVEIYEGDIVNTNEDWKPIYKVEWEEEMGKWRMTNDNYDYKSLWFVNNYEVIGNIYENRDLLTL